MVLGSIAGSDYYPMPMIGHLVYVYYYYCYYYYHYYYDHSTRTALFSDFYLKDHRFPVEHYYSTTTALLQHYRHIPHLYHLHHLYQLHHLYDLHVAGWSRTVCMTYTVLLYHMLPG